MMNELMLCGDGAVELWVTAWPFDCFDVPDAPDMWLRRAEPDPEPPAGSTVFRPLYDDDVDVLEGTRWAWLSFELGENGVECLLDADEDRLAWLLQQGLAPGQPFRVRILPPVYTRDYWGEYDCQLGDWVILERAPWTAAEHLRAWEEAMELALA